MSGGPESDPFTLTPHSEPQLDQQMRVPYSVPPPLQQVGKEGMSEQKRRRGRPRKYGTDGSMAMVMAPGPGPGPQTENLSPEVVVGSAKKPRGRPPGSTNKKKQIEAIGIIYCLFLTINMDKAVGIPIHLLLYSYSGFLCFF